jgi:hypothetical protein
VKTTYEREGQLNVGDKDDRGHDHG